MKSKAQTVEKCSGAQHPAMTHHARCVGKWIRRIGNDQHHRLGLNRIEPRNDISVNADIGIEQPQPAGRITSICRSAGFFIDARGDHHQRGALEIGVVARANHDRWRQRRAILDVRYQPARLLRGSINDDDLTCTAAHDKGCQTRRAHRAGANDGHLHAYLLKWPMRAGRPMLASCVGARTQDFPSAATWRAER